MLIANWRRRILRRRLMSGARLCATVRGHPRSCAIIEREYEEYDSRCAAPLTIRKMSSATEPSYKAIVREQMSVTIRTTSGRRYCSLASMNTVSSRFGVLSLPSPDSHCGISVSMLRILNTHYNRIRAYGDARPREEGPKGDWVGLHGMGGLFF
jgi:hypothetical protein